MSLLLKLIELNFHISGSATTLISVAWDSSADLFLFFMSGRSIAVICDTYPFFHRSTRRRQRQLSLDLSIARLLTAQYRLDSRNRQAHWRKSVPADARFNLVPTAATCFLHMHLRVGELGISPSLLRPSLKSTNQANSAFHPFGVDRWVVSCN